MGEVTQEERRNSRGRQEGSVGGAMGEAISAKPPSAMEGTGRLPEVIPCRLSPAKEGGLLITYKLLSGFTSDKHGFQILIVPLSRLFFKTA